MRIRMLAACAAGVLCICGLERSLSGRLAPEAQPATPVVMPAVGTNCHVELVPQRSNRRNTLTLTYDGQVIESDATGLKLSVTRSECRTRQTTPWASDLPVVGRFFTSVGIGRSLPMQPLEVRIAARQIAAIRSIPNLKGMSGPNETR